jgi:hypothetical protein
MMIQSYVNKSPMATIVGRNTHSSNFIPTRFVPGPGQYNAKDTRFRNTTFKFSTQHNKSSDKKNKRFNSPGPGSYKIRDDFGIGSKAFTILGKRNSKSK